MCSWPICEAIRVACRARHLLTMPLFHAKVFMQTYSCFRDGMRDIILEPHMNDYDPG